MYIYQRKNIVIKSNINVISLTYYTLIKYLLIIYNNIISYDSYLYYTHTRIYICIHTHTNIIT